MTRASGVALGSRKRRFCAAPVMLNWSSASISNAGLSARSAKRRLTRVAKRIGPCTSKHNCIAACIERQGTCGSTAARHYASRPSGCHLVRMSILPPSFICIAGFRSLTYASYPIAFISVMILLSYTDVCLILFFAAINYFGLGQCACCSIDACSCENRSCLFVHRAYPYAD
jgi:hypothetical protein